MIARAALQGPALREFIAFSVVGTIGFVVDAGLIQVLAGVLEWNPYLARILTYLCAATVTWALNRSFTFRHAKGGHWRSQWYRYLVVNAVGAGVNYLAFAATMLASETATSYPALAVAVGSIAGLAFNFTLSKALVFKPVPAGTVGGTEQRS